jgi:hypothetical protein
VVTEDHCGSSRSPLVTAAFGAGASARPVEIAPGLDAVLRVSEDGGSRLLCVHNVGDEPSAFLPGPYIPGDSSDQLVFVHGETVTRAHGEDIECVVEPGGHVWLGRATGEEKP